MGNTDLIGSAEVCEILGGIDRATLVRRVAAGKIAAAQKMPGQTGPYLFDRAEVMRHKAEVDAEAERAGGICRCGHARSDHYRDGSEQGGGCDGTQIGDAPVRCRCKGYDAEAAKAAQLAGQS